MQAYLPVWLRPAILVLIAALTLASCGQPAAPTTSAPTTSAPSTTNPTAAPAAAANPTAPAAQQPAAGGKTYVLIPKNLGNPYFDTANKGAQQAAGELGVKVLYQGSAVADPAQQVQLVNSLIAQNLAGLAIAANDQDALMPVGKAAMEAGIPTISWDATIAPGGRTAHITQGLPDAIAGTQLKLMAELMNGEGKFAILSATSQAPNQTLWLKYMAEELKKPDYAKLELVTTVYGDDEDEKSYNEAQGLLKTYPDLKGILSPTTVGIAAAARAVKDAGKIGKVMVTGLGTPNQMREYVKSGASPKFTLWNPYNLGYLAIYTLDLVAKGQLKGTAGETFKAGMLGDYKVGEDGLIVLGPLTIFDKENIDTFDF